MTAAPAPAIRTDVPARLDRLPWGRWHWGVVVALGVTWVIDGLEVTLVGAITDVLQDPRTLHFSGEQLGLLGSAARSCSRSRWGCTWWPRS